MGSLYHGTGLCGYHLHGMSNPTLPRGLAWSALVLLLGAARLCAGLQADQLLLLVNANVPESLEVADFYVKARRLPEGRILALDVPFSDEMEFDQYERQVVPAVRKYLREKRLTEQVRCLVSVYGLPLRIKNRVNTAADVQEQAALRQELMRVVGQIQQAVEDLEGEVRSGDAAFRPVSINTLEALGTRANTAFARLAELAGADADEKVTAARQRALFTALRRLSGAAGVAQLYANPAVQPAGSDGRRQAQQLQAEVEKVRAELAVLADRRFDAESRGAARALIRDAMGLFELAAILRGHIAYFETKQTMSALDNELPLLWWDLYPRSQNLPNPLHYAFRGQTQPTLMVMRLDAPQAQTVRQMILDSLQAERDGLAGQVVIDSRNIPNEPGKPQGFGGYDQSLRNLSALLRARSKLKVTFDDAPEVLPAGSAKDVAVYCGWYSLRNYIPACTFSKGAVGFHVASYEMVSLRAAQEKGWAAGLINDGVVATIGPVWEPYLHAFPPADDFFPLLMTGQLTLAEVYWRVNPLVSWMQTAIGDPLYRPYAKDPPLQVTDLPARLQRGPGRAATRPATTQSLP